MTYKVVEKKQIPIFAEDPPPPWSEEWENMPEFVQEKQESYAKIIVRVGSKEALDELSTLIGQRLTKETKSIWHPQLVRGANSSKRYVDES